MDPLCPLTQFDGSPRFEKFAQFLCKSGKGLRIPACGEIPACTWFLALDQKDVRRDVIVHGDRRVSSGFTRQLTWLRSWKLTRGTGMIEQGENLAVSLLSMPKKEFREFVRERVRSRQLTPIVVRLNSEVLSNDRPRSKAAAAALQKIGFTD